MIEIRLYNYGFKMNIKADNKYRNTKTVLDNITFDSKKEANRYYELKLLEKANEISNLELQKEFILQESFKLNNKTIRKISYITDFFYIDKQGNQVVEDTKGMLTDVYKIKKKLFMKRYGIEIKEIY